MNLPFSKNHDSKSRFFYSGVTPQKTANLGFFMVQSHGEENVMNLPKTVYKSNLYKLSWLDNTLRTRKVSFSMLSVFIL